MSDKIHGRRARKRHRTGQQNLKHVVVLGEAELALLNAHNGDRADLNEVGADRLRTSMGGWVG